MPRQIPEKSKFEIPSVEGIAIIETVRDGLSTKEIIWCFEYPKSTVYGVIVK